MKRKWLILVLLAFVDYLSGQSVLAEYTFTRPGIVSKAFVLTEKDHDYYLVADHENISFPEILSDVSLVNPYSWVIYEVKPSVFYQTLPYFFGKRHQFSAELSRDNPDTISWEVTRDIKQILGYNCTKAVGNFRGRTWEVWFAPDISANVFPWKLAGLPGVIVEAKDQENVFLWKMEKIQFNYTGKFPPGIDLFFSKYKESAVQYRKIVEIENNGLRELQSRQISDLGNGSVVLELPHYRSGSLEKSFEWEEAK